MRNVKVLEMLNEGRIEELKALLQDEIYEESLKTTPNARKRYTAMKKYFTYHKPARECLQKPCPVTFERKEYISFTNSWSLALTTEKCGEIKFFDDPERYPNVTRLISFDGVKKKIDISKVIAKAKSLGYKLTKSEVNRNFKYLMKYDGSYYKIGLLDATYSIIDNGEVAMSYHRSGERGPLTLQNDIGFCIIMPVKFESDPEEDGEHVVVDVDELD